MKLISTEFDLSSTFPVPSQITKHVLDGTNLLIAPEVPAWVLATDAEADVIQRLSRGATLAESIACLASWGVPQPRGDLSALLSRLAINGFMEANERSANPSEQITLQLHLTNACNLRCEHCYVSSGIAFEEEVHLAAWQRIVDVAVARYKTVYVSISGGEPLLVPWLPTLLRHIKAYGLRVALLSNGMLWTEKRTAELGGYVDLVNVSLDGASDSVHDAIRGRGSFRQALRGIGRIGAAGIEVGINVCLMKSNLGDIEENLRAVIESFPFPVSVLFGKYVEEGRGIEHRTEAPTAEELALVLPRLASQFLSAGLLPTAIPKRASCGFGTSFAIYANGDLSPCLSPRFIAGNIIREPIETVFERVAANAARANVDRMPLCRSCDLRYICGGKCHLPQLTLNRRIAQNECSSEFRTSFYKSLVLKATTQDRVAMPLMRHVP